MNTINVPKGKNVYFTSDHHFGAPTKAASKPREERFISWLDRIKQDADVLFILGDLFDFWFEYKYVIPKVVIPHKKVYFYALVAQFS